MKDKIIKNPHSKEVKDFLKRTNMEIEDLENLIKEAITAPLKKEEKFIKEEGEEIQSLETFADPTYDVTFKMLFGNDKHKDVLISLLNSLLGFKDTKEIKAVEFANNELPVTYFSNQNEMGISSAVDILCTTTSGQKIAIEMQRQKTKYFLAREQEYMAKLISGQVREGENKLYHEKILETYIVIITKANVFTGKSEFEKRKLFEIDVEPRIIQTNEPYPDNKMHWKFFELKKFEWSEIYKSINRDSPLKEQWLEFLIDCAKQEHEPDRNDIIKKGYDIMKTAKWDSDTKVLYWKQKQNELDLLKTQNLLKQEEFDKGKLKGEIKGEIKEIRKFLNLQKKFSEDVDKLGFLEQLKPSYKYLSEDHEAKLMGGALDLNNSGADSDIADSIIEGM